MAISFENCLFSHPHVLNAPDEGVPLEFGIGARVPNASMTGLPDGRKSFKIGLISRFDTVPAVTDTQPPIKRATLP